MEIKKSSGRPKSHAKRSAILEASGELFLKHGFKDTTMDAVAAEAGVSKQTVYSHFDGKDALLRACVEDKVREYELQADDMPDDLPLESGLRKIGRQFVDLINDENVICMYRLIISESIAHPQVARSFYETGPKATRDVIAGFLRRRAVPAGRFGDGERVAEMFFLLLEHLDVMHRVMNLTGPMPEAARDAHVARAVDQLLTLYPAA
jgi:TetR/AcrR family transcriptional repressor of mexJK operon